MAIALLADQQNQIDRRDACLRKVVELGQNLAPAEQLNTGAELAGLAELFVADLKQGGQAAFDVTDVEKRLAGKNPRGQCNFHWFLGCFLDRCKKPEAAIAQWKECLACPVIGLDAPHVRRRDASRTRCAR